MKTFLALLLGTFVLTTAAEANGGAKRATSERQVVRVYEPRAAPPAEPLLAISLLGHGLVISDNLDIDLFDIEERRRLRDRPRYQSGRIYAVPRGDRRRK